MEQKIKNIEEVKKLDKNDDKQLMKNSEIIEEKNNNIDNKFTVFGYTLSKIVAYFVIYSFLGFIIETLFGLLTKGVVESRKSFLYGPFCGIYGLGAIVMIISLKRFNKNNYTLFIGGFIVGSIIEYVISLIGEELFHIKWWDYSGMPFNINGRICIGFSLFWGILAIYLMSHLNPKVDKFIDKINPKLLKALAVTATIFFIFDLLITGFALKMFFTRLVNDYDLELQNVDRYRQAYTELYNQPEIKEIVNKYLSYEKMLHTFPNIKVTGKDGNIIWVCDILKDIQPYYFRVFEPKLR